MAELIDLPEVEVLDGRPYPKVSPKRTHAQVQLALALALRRCGGKAGITATEWRFKVERGTELIPDVAWVSRDRLQHLSPGEVEEPPFAPDVAGEVRSPSHRPGLLIRKLAKYFAHGAQAVLDVDPHARSVLLYQRERAVRFGEGERLVSQTLPWLAFDVDELFEDLDIPD
jgi:Uma2 family endonuclease